jgi:cephalosporin-C deacetylase
MENMIEHPFDFDPTCGYTEAELLAVTPPDTEPADFVTFWQNTFTRTTAIGPESSLRPIWSPDADIELFEVNFTSWDQVRIGAFLARPRQSRGGLVSGHGYGGLPNPVIHKDMTVIAPCIRGFNLSRHHAFPWRSGAHVVHGIAHRDTYILRGAVADIWQAATVLTQIFPDTADNLVYSGGSFGGGLGALAVPWDDRLRAARLDVPTFGHHPLRLQFPCTGSGEAVRTYHATHPEVERVLAYYDAATAATHIRIPTVCTPALFDPAVVPPGQFAVNNAIRPDLRQTFVLQAGHWTVEADASVRQAAAAATEALFVRN